MAMPTERIKQGVSSLIKEGGEILAAEVEANLERLKRSKAKASEQGKDPNEKTPTIVSYQSWYTRALPVVRQLLPDRYQEFQDQYNLTKRDNKNITFLTYTISDYLLGLRITKGYQKEDVVDPFSTFISKFTHQITILMTVRDRIDSILSDIRGVLEAELSDDELEAASELLRKGHVRPAGTLAGIALERHLAKVCIRHDIRMKKDPSISDYNDALKNNEIFDVPNWRLIQRLGDIRNLCTHAKGREPARDEVEELILGVQKAVKTLF